MARHIYWKAFGGERRPGRRCGAAIVRWVLPVAAVLIAACGGDEDARSRAEQRAACYPACLGEVIARCPLVDACTVSISGFTSYGAFDRVQQGYGYFTWRDDFSKVLGAHTLKFGVMISHGRRKSGH